MTTVGLLLKVNLYFVIVTFLHIKNSQGCNYFLMLQYKLLCWQNWMLNPSIFATLFAVYLCRLISMRVKIYTSVGRPNLDASSSIAVVFLNRKQISCNFLQSRLIILFNICERGPLMTISEKLRIWNSHLIWMLLLKWPWKTVKYLLRKLNLMVWQDTIGDRNGSLWKNLSLFYLLIEQTYSPDLL